MSKVELSSPIILLPDEISCLGKNGLSEENGDRLYNGKYYKAVFDGATPKGTRLWDGLPGDVFISKLLCEALHRIDPGADAQSVITSLNNEIRDSYRAHGVSFADLEPEERLQASSVIFSCARREVWVFGDCSVKINDRMYRHTRAGDKLLADLRAFCTELFVVQGSHTGEVDPGRAAIMPFLKAFPLLANQGGEFGYDALNGGTIHAENVVIYPVRRGDRVILASDGYPELFDTLAETERYLLKMVGRDPACVKEIRGTKGVNAGMQSYDDRSYISFYVG